MPIANYKRPAKVITNAQMTCLHVDHFNEDARKSPPFPSPPPTSHGLSGGDIAGVVIGVLTAVALVLALAAWFWRRRRKSSPEAKHASDPDDPRMAEFPDTGKPRHEVDGIALAEASPDAEAKMELNPDAQLKHELSPDATLRHELSAGSGGRPELPGSASHQSLEIEKSALEPVELPAGTVEEKEKDGSGEAKESDKTSDERQKDS